MNFLNTLISGASNLIFNLQQRDHSGVSQLFQQNNPSLSLSPSEEFNSRKGSNNNHNNKAILANLLLSNNSSISKAQHIPPNNYEQNQGKKQIDASKIINIQQTYFNSNNATHEDLGIQFNSENNGSFPNTNNTLNNNNNNNNLPLPNIQIEDQMQQSYLLSQLIIAQQKNLIGQLLQASQSQNQTSQNIGFTTPQSIVHPAADQTQNEIQMENLSSNKMDSNLGRINKQEHIDDSPEISCPLLKKSLKKPQKKVNNCGHHDKEHYAKGMCSNCYHKYGRTKKPWLCPHTKLYACGLCQNCYINKYNQRKRVEGSEQIEGLLDGKNMESTKLKKNISQADMFTYSDNLQKTQMGQHAVVADGDDEQEGNEEKHQQIVQ